MCIFLKVGLGDGSALPVGVPVPWALSAAPIGWLKCNGAAFSAAQYPKLAQVYPALVLPDLRGEFIRGWDDGRGIDTGRAVSSTQQATKINGQLFGNDGAGTGNAWYCDQDISHDFWESETIETMSRNVAWGRLAIDPDIRATALYRYAGSIRPRNVAFNYIVRAA
ncbi:phage tail protein [Cedecea neteri]|uniref:phage tail protein n=1 Tax=Cedecea neteri TaxID=158822 RepID=UPI001E2C333F|nr:phage tail protein [Cedecea neteri]